ncbi:MAG TPA: hypothetical protein VHP33_37815 [Polyangiaceae bacterium]|nr:hypothetical protein [Polyangiaceae bacterium]
MTHLLGELGGTARDFARTGLAVTVVLALALGITVARALSPEERGPSP